jgi:hypothetical protein
MVVYGSDEEALGQIGIVFFEKGCNGYDPKMLFFLGGMMMISFPLHIWTMICQLQCLSITKRVPIYNCHTWANHYSWQINSNQ